MNTQKEPSKDIASELAIILRKRGWTCTPPDKEEMPTLSKWMKDAMIPVRIENTIRFNYDSMEGLIGDVLTHDILRNRNFGEKSLKVLREILEEDGLISLYKRDTQI